MTDATTPCKVCHAPYLPFPLGEKENYAFNACKACNSVMAEPWPTAEVIDKFFGDIQPEIVHLAKPEERIKKIKKTIAKITPNFTGRRFLDVSCRQGYAVMAAKELGFQAHGIDGHDFFIAFAKDKYDPHLFERCTVQEYAARGGQAEFIYADEALCEQTDPDSYVAALSKILAPGGKIYIREPDGNHMRLPTIFTNWNFVDPPLNFLYPSKKGMEALLARHGLKIEKKFLTWMPFMRLVIVRR